MEFPLFQLVSMPRNRGFPRNVISDSVLTGVPPSTEPLLYPDTRPVATVPTSSLQCCTHVSRWGKFNKLLKCWDSTAAKWAVGLITVGSLGMNVVQWVRAQRPVQCLNAPAAAAPAVGPVSRKLSAVGGPGHPLPSQGSLGKGSELLPGQSGIPQASMGRKAQANKDRGLPSPRRVNHKKDKKYKEEKKQMKLGERNR